MLNDIELLNQTLYLAAVQGLAVDSRSGALSELRDWATTIDARSLKLEVEVPDRRYSGQGFEEDMNVRPSVQFKNYTITLKIFSSLHLKLFSHPGPASKSDPKCLVEGWASLAILSPILVTILSG
jgi:hypothetical protein